MKASVLHICAESAVGIGVCFVCANDDSRKVNAMHTGFLTFKCSGLYLGLVCGRLSSKA